MQTDLILTLFSVVDGRIYSSYRHKSRVLMLTMMKTKAGGLPVAVLFQVPQLTNSQKLTYLCINLGFAAVTYLYRVMNEEKPEENNTLMTKRSQ